MRFRLGREIYRRCGKRGVDLGVAAAIGLLLSPVIVAVEILPAEIPRESSTHFSSVLKHYIPHINAADWDSDFDQLHLSAEIKNAVILHRGKLTPDYRYLQAYL